MLGAVWFDCPGPRADSSTVVLRRGDDFGSGAHPDDFRALGRLALEPSEDCRVIVAAHGGDYDEVGAFRWRPPPLERETRAHSRIVACVARAASRDELAERLLSIHCALKIVTALGARKPALEVQLNSECRST
jgi:hypothetical protein